MQVCCVDPQPYILPPSDIDKMKSELATIDKLMKDIAEGKSTTDTYNGLKNAVMVIDGIILSLDNSNDFFKIGGFNRLIPLLTCSNDEVVTATAELIADLCQNNTFCQTKALDCGILPELVKQIESPNSNIRLKALYALSCLCHHNEDSVNRLKDSNAIPVLLRVMQQPDQKLRAKSAFFLAHLCDYHTFREEFYSEDLVPILIKMLSESQDSSSEHLLSALLNQVSQHVQSRVQSSSEECNLKEVLLTKLKFYDSKEEFEESIEYCNKLLALCFPGVNKEL